MNYVDVFYRSVDGLKLYARDYPGPALDAPVVLCLPGLTRNSKDFAALAEALSARYRVLCPDQRGRGRSARDADAGRYRPDVYVGDMWTLLDLMGVTEVALIGTSLGGLMAMLMMMADPARIRGMVLNDIGPEIDPRGLERIAGYVGKSPVVRDWREAAEQTRLTNGIAFPDYQPHDWLAMARELYVQEGALPVLDYDPAISSGFVSGTVAANAWPLFESMAAKPMLAIRGETSDILSIETFEKMKRRMPRLSTVTIPGRGHAPSLRESQAREAIDRFLDGLALARQ